MEHQNLLLKRFLLNELSSSAPFKTNGRQGIKLELTFAQKGKNNEIRNHPFTQLPELQLFEY